jgi:site-specific recombinase XerD
MGRKTHSTIGIQKGVDPMTISKQMGHSGLEMTSRYVGVDEKKLKSMFDFLETRLITEVKKEIHEEIKTEVKEDIQQESIEEKLVKLKGLFEKKLITKKVYEEKMKDIL